MINYVVDNAWIEIHHDYGQTYRAGASGTDSVCPPKLDYLMCGHWPPGGYSPGIEQGSVTLTVTKQNMTDVQISVIGIKPNPCGC